MIRRSLYLIIGFAIAIVVVVAGFFLLEIEQIAINLWAFAFLILSLLVSMSSLVTITQRKAAAAKDAVFYNAGTSAVVWIYQVAVVISVAFVGAFNEKVGRFVLVEIIIIAVFAIITLAVNLFARHAHSSNVKTLESQENGEYSTPKRGGF